MGPGVAVYLVGGGGGATRAEVFQKFRILFWVFLGWV